MLSQHYTLLEWLIKVVKYTDRGLTDHQARKRIAKEYGVSMSVVSRNLKRSIESYNQGLETLRALGLLKIIRI